MIKCITLQFLMAPSVSYVGVFKMVLINIIWQQMTSDVIDIVSLTLLHCTVLSYIYTLIIQVSI